MISKISFLITSASGDGKVFYGRFLIIKKRSKNLRKYKKEEEIIILLLEKQGLGMNMDIEDDYADYPKNKLTFNMNTTI